MTEVNNSLIILRRMFCLENEKKKKKRQRSDVSLSRVIVVGTKIYGKERLPLFIHKKAQVNFSVSKFICIIFQINLILSLVNIAIYACVSRRRNKVRKRTKLKRFNKCNLSCKQQELYIISWDFRVYRFVSIDYFAVDKRQQ